MESANRIGQGIGVTGDGYGYPRVCELETQSPTSPKKKERLAIDSPSLRMWSEDTFNWIGGARPNDLQLSFKIAVADQLGQVSPS